MGETELQVQINEYTNRVEELTALALSGSDGLEKVAKSVGLQISISKQDSLRLRITSPQNHMMRAVARAVLPSNWNWDVLEMVGGECHLVVTSVHDMLKQSAGQTLKPL